MSKVAFKIFGCFTLLSALTAMLLLALNALSFAFVGSDHTTHIHDLSAKGMVERMGRGLTKTESGFVFPEEVVLPAGCWCILIDEGGDVIWSKHMPGDIPAHYSINDVARMTRWFLNDYPVYVYTRPEGLLVLGLPKNSVSKFEMDYSRKWFKSLPQRLAGIVLFNLFLAVVVSFALGLVFYQRIRTLTDGIRDLKQEKPVKLREKGIFKELARNINMTSRAIERKNAMIGVRERARQNWVSGISHDIRTPLTVIMGNSQVLEYSGDLPEEYRKSASVITAQAVRIKQLVADLNLISSLEYDMQPAKKQPVRLCPLLRETVSDMINSGQADCCEIELSLQDEKMTVCADKSLLERAVFNLVNNSVTHNENGCHISIRAYCEEKKAHVHIADDGCGIPVSVIEKISQMPDTVHGLGLPMAYKIVEVHGGSMAIQNDGGCRIEITLPLMDEVSCTNLTLCI